MPVRVQTRPRKPVFLQLPAWARDLRSTGVMSPRGNHTFHVWVVDDDPSVLATYRRLLDRCGYSTETLSDPRQALEDRPNGAAGRPDLIVLDYKMPGMDGLTLLAELRRRECQARCILISAYLNDDVRKQAEVLGVDRVLGKPIDCASLRRTIAELLPLPVGRPIAAGQASR